MPDLSTIFRDLGTVPTLVGLAFIALLVYSIAKGGSKDSGNGSKGGGSSTPPSA